MNVGIIGTGTVATALAGDLAAAGHDVVLGSRTPEADVDAPTRVRSQHEAADPADAVVLAVPSDVVVDIATDLADALAGTPTLDATNEFPTPRASRPLAQRVADAAPGADVVKAFNTVGANRMTDPVVGGVPATMFVAGDDPAAVATAESLASDLGFEPLDAGGLAAAGHLESLARFWIHLSRDYGRDVAFRLLRE
jgi:predicted dinucleotide-binding enzyme